MRSCAMPPTAMAERAGVIEWAVAGRPIAGEDCSGDEALVCAVGRDALVAAIDGVGHGSAAARAARVAVNTLRAARWADVVALTERCHAALRSTRGAAVGLAVLRGDGTATWLGVGNIAGCLVHGGQPSPTAGHWLPSQNRGGRRRASTAAARLAAAASRRRARARHRRNRRRLRRRPRRNRIMRGDRRAGAGRACARDGRRARGRGAVPGRGHGMSAQADDLIRRYGAALHEAVAEPGEKSLSAAYDLGRDAVRSGLSVLDLAAAHTEGVAAELHASAAPAAAERMARAAGAFFLE